MGARTGAGVEVFWGMVSDEVENESENSFFYQIMPLGATFDFGCRISETASLGLGVSVYSQPDYIWNYTPGVTPAVAVGVNVRAVFHSRSEGFTYDTRVAYSNGSSAVVDLDTVTLDRIVHNPIFWENTLIFVNETRTTFLVIKQLNDVCWDSVFYYGRLLPAVEHCFADWFSMRVGLEGACVVLNDSSSLGYRALLGFTFRNVKKKWEIDANFSYRKKPSPVVEGMMRDDIFIMFAFSRNNLFLSRE